MDFLSLACMVFLSGRAVAAVPAIRLVPDSAWNALNQSVGGRLANGRPLALPCYSNYNGSLNTQVDLAQCADIQLNKNDGVYLSDHFGSYQYTNWADCSATGDSCPLAFLGPDIISPIVRPCKQGSIPERYIEVQTVSDIQAGLAFAKKYSIPLVIKNSGHDYKGRSSAPNSLALWMHKMTPPIKLTRNYVADGCSTSNGDSITFGGGQPFGGVYDFAHQNKLHIVGGTSKSVVPAGGWITGGGHSALSNHLGLGVDNVQQLRAVLPNGTYITANRCQHQDLFFALRGGGGGTFGVITEMTTRAHPAEELQYAQFIFGSLSPVQVKKLLDIMVQNANKWASEGWGGYAIPAFLTTQTSGIALVTPQLSLEEAKASMKPVTDYLSSLPALTIPLVFSITTIPEFYDFFQSPAGKSLDQLSNMGTTVASRIIPSTLFDGSANQTKVSNALYDIVSAGQVGSTVPLIPLFILIVAPSNYKVPDSDLPGGPGASSVTPSWRKGVWHVMTTRNFDSANPLFGSLGGAGAVLKATHDAMNPLRAMTPESGAYQNEADSFENDPISTFWGKENYDRLLKIKEEVDPGNLLTCHQCVGWDSSDPRFGCYPKDPN